MAIGPDAPSCRGWPRSSFVGGAHHRAISSLKTCVGNLWLLGQMHRVAGGWPRGSLTVGGGFAVVSGLAPRRARSSPYLRRCVPSDTPRHLKKGLLRSPARRCDDSTSPLTTNRRLLARRLPLFKQVVVADSLAFGLLVGQFRLRGAPGWSNQYCASRSGFIFGPHTGCTLGVPGAS